MLKTGELMCKVQIKKNHFLAYSALIALTSLLWINTAISFNRYLDLESMIISNGVQIISTEEYEKERAQTYKSGTKKTGKSQKNKKKKWTIIIYIAADNDLRSFAARNIKQMASIGSNDLVNIIVHIDIRITSNNKITRRYFVEKDKVVHINANDSLSQQMDSGDPKTLISCIKWAMADYPAEDVALVFWDHGTGILDPQRGRVVNPLELFTFNPDINKLELDRSIGFIDLVSNTPQQQRGICWDDSTGNYLTNQKLDAALTEARSKYMNNNKLSLLCFDACLMSMVEVGSMIKKHAHITVGSEEVVLGPGWDYNKVLAPFATTSMSKESLAKHIVDMYGSTYNLVTNDLTQSAIYLDRIETLEENINTTAQLLIKALKGQNGAAIKSAIKASRNKLVCTHFDEPSYIDIHHFYSNLIVAINKSVCTTQETQTTKQEIIQSLERGAGLIGQVVFANIAGKNLSKAKGLSIYFPEHKIHPSYYQTAFAKKNSWLNFLTQYLLN